MPNAPRPENRHREVRVEDALWVAAGEAAADLGTTRSEVMREALRGLVSRTNRVDMSTSGRKRGGSERSPTGATERESTS